MKSIIIAFALIALGLQSQAQTEKGTKTLGLNVSYSFYNYSNTPGTANQNKNTVFSIGPNFSYFIANQLDLGINLNYYHTNNYNYSNSDASYQRQLYNSGSATIYARKYFMYQNKIGIRTGPYVSYNQGSQTTKYSPSYGASDFNYQIREYGIGANLDLLYYPTKNIGISASIANLAYSHQKISGDNGDKNNQDNLTMGFITNGIGLSLFYAFCGK